MERNEELPKLVSELLIAQYDALEVERIIAGYRTQRAVTLRANTLKVNRANVAAALDEANISWEAVPWYDDAFILPEATERDVWNLPLYARGEIYLQSLSSMMPALALDARAGEDVCDLCAAPGGKTTQIAALSGAYITACEMHAPRAEKLEYNLNKLGDRNVTVMRCDARKLDDFFSFDRILLDAPCSGSGTLVAGSEKAARRFTRKLVDKSVKSQRALIQKALSLLRVGGTLVYSTCSVLECENEDIVRFGLERTQRGKSFQIQPFAIENADSLPMLPTTLEGTLALYPTRYYEGFFIAKITRNA